MDAIPDAESLLTNHAPLFHVEVGESAKGVAVVVLEGEVDINASSDFKRVLLPLAEDGARHIVVDATGVTFMDSTALGVLLSGEKRLRPRGGSIVIASRGSISRLFEVTGLDRVFTICNSQNEGLRLAATRQGCAPDRTADPSAAGSR